LARRLEVSRWPDELPDVGWEYGVASGFLCELADRWRREYDRGGHFASLQAPDLLIDDIRAFAHDLG
jgi:hypothetical protein